MDSKKGVGGGFQLARDTSEISFLEILESLDGPVAVNTCQGKNACDHTGFCSLEPIWAKAQNALLDVLRTSTLAETLGTPIYPLVGVTSSDVESEQ